MTSKNDVLTSILTYFCQKPGCSVPCQTPPFCLVLLLLQITWRREKSCRAVVRSPVRRQNKFQSVSGRGPRRVRGGGGFSVGPTLWLLLSGQQAPHRSRKFPQTRGLYSAVTHHTRHPLPRPDSFNLDLIGRPLLVRKWGLLLPHRSVTRPGKASLIRVNTSTGFHMTSRMIKSMDVSKSFRCEIGVFGWGVRRSFIMYI